MSAIVLIRNAALIAAVYLGFAGVLGIVPLMWPWRRMMKTSTLVAAVAQMGIVGGRVARKEREPSALVLPLVAAVCSAAWLAFPEARYLTIAGPVVDLGLVVALIVFAGRAQLRDGALFEESFGRLMRRFFPARSAGFFARVTALDVGGFAYLARGWRKPPPAGIAYHRGNATLALVVLVAFAALPEAFVVELFLLGKPLVWHVLDIVAHLYVVFWVLAVYVSFRDRPHTVEGDTLVVRRGLFNTIRISRSYIASAAAAPPLNRTQRRALPRDAAWLGIFESPLIRLTLNAPTALENFAGQTRLVSTVYLPVDDAHKALAAIDRFRLAPSETLKRPS